MIGTEDAFVVFNAGTPLERVALRGVSISVQDGEIVSILGNNGSGRSTLLRAVAGHIPLSFGRLWYNNVDITAQPLYARSKIVAPVFAEHSVCSAEGLTVLENLVLATLSYQPKSWIKKAVQDDMEDRFYSQLRNLNFMDMDQLLHEKVCDIANPYKHILALLIAIIKGVKILVIDEHSTGLDVETAQTLLNATMKIIKSKKLTTIMAINDPEFAIRNSDRIITLNYGQVVADVSGEQKKKIKLEDLYLTFNKKPQISSKKAPVSI